MKDNLQKFRIIRIEESNGRRKKVTIECFDAKDVKAAYKYLLKYRKTHAGEFYWDYAHQVIDGFGNDKTSIFDDIDLKHDDVKRDKYEFEVTVTLKQNGKALKTKTFKNKFRKQRYERVEKDVMHGFDDFKFIVENYDNDSNSTHCRSEYWSIDHHVMNDIMFNIERLKKNKTGCPWFCVDEAKKELDVVRDQNTDEKTDAKVMDLAMKIWDRHLDELSYHIRAYQFYTDYGILDEGESKPDFCDVPILPGSFDCIDYKKNGEYAQFHWKAWIKKFEEIGQAMWD